MISSSDLTTHYRFRAPGSQEVIGVHEAARRAGEMLSARGDTIAGALLTAEYHAAVANRDGVQDARERIAEEMERKDNVSKTQAEVAVLAALAFNASTISARLQVYMAAFAPEYARVHPDDIERPVSRPGQKRERDE